MDMVMKKLLLTLLISVSLYGQNPVAFAALGDVIYNDLPKFEQLSSLAAMRDFKPMIDDYIQAASESKKLGFAVDRNEGSADPKGYLTKLRTLSTEHDAIILNARTRFEEAMEDAESETLTKMIAIGIVDPQDYKSRLVQYYEDYGEEQNLSAIEPLYREHLLDLAREQNSTKGGDTEAMKKEELLKRMRATEKASNDALTRSVREECEREKQNVMNEQKKALGIE